MNKNSINIFYIKTSLFVLAVFALNYFHQVQQGTYEIAYLGIANNLLNGNGYTYSSFNGEPATYPIWGFVYFILPGFPSGIPHLSVLFAHFLLTFIGIFYFYKIFKLTPKFYHNFLFLPFYAMMSVKWPDAAVAATTLPAIFYALEYLKTDKLKLAVYSGIFFGLILNFRSEFIYFPIFAAILSVLFFKRINLLKQLKLIGIIAFISYVMIMPWAIRQFNVMGKFTATSTNGGTVAYISLGELPGNKWNIMPIDQSAGEFVNEKGIENQYSREGDELLKRRFFELIKDDPIEYSFKCINNLMDALTGGVYTGEFSTLFISENRMNEINNHISSIIGIRGKTIYVTQLNVSESFPILTEKFIRAIFMIVLIALLINVFFGKMSKLGIPYIYLFVLALLLYKLLLVSALQYEYRHMNQIYMFILGLTMLSMKLKINANRSNT